MIERAELPVMNKKVMSQVEKGFNKFQDKTKNEIAVIKKNISDETKKMNRLTSFNKESLVKRKNVIANKIKGLESQLNQKEKLLNNTDIAVWFDTMASKNLKKQMSTGKSNAQLVQEYWKNKNL
jgi:outer membrane cobalamin receptor